MNKLTRMSLDPSFGTFQWKDLAVFLTAGFFFIKTLLWALSKVRKSCEGSSSDKDKSIYSAYYELPGPRPFPLKFIGNAMRFFPFRKTELLDKLLKLTKEYGSCYRLTLLNEDYVVLNSGEHVQALLMSNDDGHLGKGGLEEKLWPKELIQGLVTYTGDDWRIRRKMLNRSFTYKSLQRYNTCYNKQSDRAIKELLELYSDGKVHDVDRIMKTCILRISSETLMGVDLTDSEDGARFCEYTEIAMDATFERLYRPWLYPDWIWKLHPLAKRQLSALQECAKVVSKVIDVSKEELKKRENSNSQTNDIIAKEDFIEASHDYDNMIEAMIRNGVSDEDIFQEVAMMLAIAHDTTSVSVLFTLFMIALHPQHQEICREEVDAIFADPTKCKSGTLEYEALAEMKYLERCILEAQRIHPVGTVMRKLETPLRLSDDLVLPPGVTPFYNGYLLHMNPDVFPNPKEFNPDRFLPEEIRARHRFSFCPFSGGPRNCIGKKLAIIEMKVLFAKILHNFEISTVDKREEVKVVLNGIPKPAKPIKFIFKKRV